MCDYASYREQGYEPRQPDESEEDPLKKWKAHPFKRHKEMQFLEDVIR